MSTNNLFEISKQLYYRFGEIDDYEKQVLEVRQFIQNNPILNHEVIQYEENIKQLLFLRELIVQEGFLKVLKKMKRLKISIILLKQELRLYELAAYFDLFLDCFCKMMKYHCFQKISNLLMSCSTYSPEEFIPFFQDISLLPIDELTGYNVYSNPIFRLVIQDDIFSLYDQMNKESFETFERIKKECLNAYCRNDIDLLKYFEIIRDYSDKDVALFSSAFENCIKKILHLYSRKINADKNRSRNLKPDPFEYYGSLAVF